MSDIVKKKQKPSFLYEFVKLCTAFVTVLFLDYLFGYTTGFRILAFIMALLTAVFYTVLPDDDSSKVKNFYNNHPVCSLVISLVITIVFCFVMVKLSVKPKDTVPIDLINFFIDNPAILTSSILLYAGASNQKLFLILTPKESKAKVCFCARCTRNCPLKDKKAAQDKE